MAEKKQSSKKERLKLPDAGYFESLFVGRISRVNYFVGYLIVAFGIPVAVAIAAFPLAIIGLSVLPIFVGWAIALVAAGLWATKENKRYLVNVVASFGTIHFYTQWFEYFGAKPWSLVVSGIIAIMIGIALWEYNKNLSERHP